MCHCNQCGSDWEPNARSGGNPVQCPRCKRVDWREPKKGIRDGQSRSGDQGSGDHRRDGSVRGHRSDSGQGAGEVRFPAQEPSDCGSNGSQRRSDDREGIAVYPRPEEVIAQFEEDRRSRPNLSAGLSHGTSSMVRPTAACCRFTVPR